MGASVIAAGCGSPAAGGESSTLRLGYLPNLTHAPALVGVAQGYFARALGPRTTLRTQAFNAGPSAIEALFAGSLDAAFVGPSPAINAFAKSHGEAIRVVAGATAGGAALVVQGDGHITSSNDLRGKRIATPQLGNTQDVALRKWLANRGLKTSPQGGGDALVAPTDNSTILQLFKSHAIDAAWVPEPYASRLVVESSGRVLVDEADLWPGGRFPTSMLIVSTAFLGDHPDVVNRLIRGELDTIDVLRGSADAPAAANAALGRLAQKGLNGPVLAAAWAHLTFDADPLASALQREASDARAVGLLSDATLNGLLDVRGLNAVLRERGQPAVSSRGLGRG
ncbi:MAG: ABC transporter substrate-binding protein [Candidatus Dormibacteria bacterium]